MLKMSNKNYTAKQLSKMMEKGTVKFDNAVQRGLVWDERRKSLLIHSMIVGYPIPPLFAAKTTDGSLDCLDGKQRCNAISEYIAGKFALDTIPEIQTEDGMVDISGKKFSELSTEFQDEITGYLLVIYSFDNITDDEVNEMFFRLNNGKSLTGIELTRVKAKSIEMIKNIGKHSLFDAALTDKAINKYTNEDIVIKSWAVLNQERPSFETKEIRPMIEAADITEAQAEAIKTAFTRIHEVYNIISKRESKEAQKAAKRLITRTHLISVVPMALQSVSDNVGAETFASWVEYFFAGKKNATIDIEYNQSAGAGSGKADSVAKRLKAIKSSYTTFVKAMTDEFKPNTNMNMDMDGEPESKQNEPNNSDNWEDISAIKREPEHEFNPSIYKDQFAEFNDIEVDEDVDIDALLENKEDDASTEDTTIQDADCAA